MAERQIFAMGGGGFSMEENPALDNYALSLTGEDRPRVCFLPTGSGDADGYITRFYAAFPVARAYATHVSLFPRTIVTLRTFLLQQDLIYVGGGSTANMLAVWRIHGVDRILREAWQAGVVLCGISAGMNCWFESSVTDSFGPLAPLTDGLGMLAGSACPHYDGDPARRPTYHTLLAAGTLPPGIAADDGVGLHYVGDKLASVVTSRRGARAYLVSSAGEQSLPAIELPGASG